MWQGHEGKYSIYVHASREKPEHISPIFVGRDIHSAKVCKPHLLNFQTLYLYGCIRSQKMFITQIYNNAHYMQVFWGKISMVDAEKRLLANALQDKNNQQFVLLSDR